MVAVEARRQPPRRLGLKLPPPPPLQQPLEAAEGGVAWTRKGIVKRRRERNARPADGARIQEEGGGPGATVEEETEIELMVDTMQKKIPTNTKGLFLPERNRLKNFTIPKRTVEKDFLTACSPNERDYSEVKQRLTQSFLDTEFNFENFWQIDKIEMVQNKHLEEEFVAKRAKLREEGKQDKELPSFLIVSNDEVSQICQNGLQIGHSKKQLKIMNELGNPQLGVYLFRYVDVALNYASNHSTPVENIIIFRVLLGKVKKVEPPKGKTKIALDPTPNFDCHMSRVHPSLKDSLEDQAISSLVYFYEYNEVPKPVDKPRQCLPYAVIKVKHVNWKMQVGSTRTSLKCRSKRLPKNVGRCFPLQNTTVVTRIGKSKLIYEHFRKPVESFLWRSAEDSENSAPEEFCSSSGRMQNWNASSVETQHRKKAKHNSCRRWDLATNELTIQRTPGMDVSRDIISDHMGNKPSKMHIGVSAGSAGGLCIVTTSRSIKDPRLTRREQILGKENGETAFHESSQYEKELEYNLEAQISATVGIPYIAPEESFLLNSKHAFSQRQYMEKITWKENSSEECVSPPLLNSEQGLSNINNEVLASQNTYTDPALETHLNNNSFKFKDIKSKHSVRVGENLNGRKGMKHSELRSLQLSPYKTVGNVWIPQDYQPGNKEHERIIEPHFYDDNDKCVCRKNPEGVTASENKMGAREEVSSELHDADDDDDNSEKHCSADLDRKCVANNCTSEKEHSSEYCSIQDNTLQSEFCEKLNLSENVLREVYTEDKYICERSSDEMSMEYFEQNELRAVTQSEKSSTTEVQKKTGQIYSASENAKPTIDEKKEHIVMELKESAVKERIRNINCTCFSNGDSEMLDKTFLCRESIPEVCEQVVEVECEDVQDFKVASKSEDMWEGYKKCLSVPEELHDHENMAGEEEEYHFLQKRMDWDNVFGKPNLNTNIPGNPSVNENVHEYLHGGKSGMEKKETGSFNTFVYPDLEITVTCSFHSKLKKETWKCASKYSGQKQNIKSLRNKTMEKYTEGEKNSKFYLPKKQCSSETFSSLSKRQIKKILQSEKHLKNILNTLNREAILCKNKHLSQKIGGALFHLRKAQRRVHSLKIKAKARKKKSNDPLPKIHRIVHNGSLPSDSFVTSGCLSDMSCSSDNERDITRTEVEIISEKSTLNPGSTNISNHEHTMNDEQSCVKFISRNIMKDRVTTLMEDTKQNLSSEDNRCASQNAAKQFNQSIVEKEFVVSHVDKRKGENISDRKVDIVRFATTVHTALESFAEEDVFTPGDTSRLSPIFMPENGFSRENQIMEIVSAQDDINMSITAERYSADNNLFLPSPDYALQEPEDKRTAFLETKGDFSGINQYVINDILVKPLMKTDLDKKNMTRKIHITPGKESTGSQTSSNSSKLHSSLLIRCLSEQHVEAIIASSPSAPTHYDVLPTETEQKLTSSMTRQNENSYSGELSNINADLSSGFKCTQAETEVKSLDFKIKIPEILQKADETSSLNLLHEQIISCKYILPVFLEAFQKKQGCSFEHVLVSREIIESTGRNLQPSQKLNPCAIESLVELQIVMETIEFIENKKRYMESEPTFRSLLWYDSSLCSELFGGQAGYQQQSNFYPTFQRRLKYNPLNELQSYHKELVDVFENTRWEKNSYYTFLKARREIEECEAAMKSNFSFSDFFLSVPFVCGANYGDTLEDLEATRKNTMHLITICKSHPGISLSAEKEDHFWIIMEIIGTKIEFIRTCEEVNIKASLFGLEHIFFDAAKSLVWKEKEKSINGNAKDGQMLNQVSLSAVYETYEHMIRRITKQSVQQSCIHEKTDGQKNTKDCITNSLILHHDICCIGEILDEAKFATIERLEQLMCDCLKQMERLKKYFLALQEEDVSVLIEIENVLGFMKSDGINPVILKPEAVEVYTEMAMIYETVFYLKNSIAIKVDKPRFRSLLWFDLSLLPELFRCQEKMASLSYRKDNLLKIIESSISELQEELNVIYDYSENLNCPYALHLLTRELAELSETRNLLKTSKSPISMCVDLVPYTICLNYGSTVYELECNYNQFSSLLEKLMLAERKDLGKMAHIMKIMKTIEHMKFVCSEQGKSPLPLVIHQMLKNWRKARQLKRQDMKTDLDDTEGHSTKHSSQHSQAQYKRPVNITLDGNLNSSEEKNDFSQSKEKGGVIKERKKGCCCFDGSHRDT